jgi:hypothetical protein
MPEAEPGVSTVVILLVAATGLLFILLLTVIGIRNRLGRIERLLASKKEPVAAQTPLVEVDSPSGGVFESFLNEDPSRKELSKKEQAAAYRRWRQEKGMNWSNS